MSSILFERHSFQELIDAGKMELEERWPQHKRKNKAKQPDNGLLSVKHPPINSRADKGHYVWNSAKFFFALRGQRKKRKDAQGSRC
jgi:hypothetical protein